MKPYLFASILFACSTLAAAGAFGLPQARHPDHNQSGAPSSLLPPGQSFETPEQLGRGPQLSAKDAAREAQQINGGGRVLSVDTANGGWRVKLLKDGNVRIVFVAQ